MVLVHLIQPSLIASAEDDAEYVGGKKLAEWEIFIVNYLQWSEELRVKSEK
jgi:hypothetical protein